MLLFSPSFAGFSAVAYVLSHDGYDMFVFLIALSGCILCLSNLIWWVCLFSSVIIRRVYVVFTYFHSMAVLCVRLPTLDCRVFFVRLLTLNCMVFCVCLLSFSGVFIFVYIRSIGVFIFVYFHSVAVYCVRLPTLNCRVFCVRQPFAFI